MVPPAAHRLFEATGAALRRSVPYDGAAWLTTDPRTTLFTGGVIDALPPATCHPFFDNELSGTDAMPFAELAKARTPAGALGLGLGRDKQNSPRWRDVLEPYGYGDELRAAFVADGRCWGVASLWRAAGEPPFSAADVDRLAQMAPGVGRGLRAAVLHQVPVPAADAGPAVILLDGEGRVRGSTTAAAAYLEQVVAGRDEGFRFQVLDYARSIATRTRGAAGEGTELQVRTQVGTWLTLRASALAVDGGPSTTAVVLSPSAPWEVLDNWLAASGLTTRELEVLGLVCRDFDSTQIAEALFISPYTARDHVKAIRTKLGVGSRGELLSRLFVEHYLDRLLSNVSVQHS